MEQKQPLVSVIVPNYNHARYLEQRLDSVFNQTYLNFEVIILDDCSTDNSLEVIDRYKDNPHLSQIVVNETNSGSVFKQWDKGINLAKGELIWIAESDDYCELNLLEELVGAMMAKPNVVVAFSSYVMFSDDGYWSRSKNRSTQYYDGLRFVKGWMSMENAIMNASGAVFKREAYYNLLSREHMSYRGSGDWLFWSQIAVQGNVAFVRKNLTYFRLSPKTVTGQNMQSGLARKEDLNVQCFINEHFHLSPWQKHMASVFHDMKYSVKISWLERKEIWIAGFLRRHFGILVP